MKYETAMKKPPILLLMIAWGLSGCAAHLHTVGLGSEGRSQHSVDKRQFYVLDWKPLNTVDTRLMAASIPAYTPAYTIFTRRTFTDILIAALTGA